MVFTTEQVPIKFMILNNLEDGIEKEKTIFLTKYTKSKRLLIIRPIKKTIGRWLTFVCEV